jgi:NAD(P)-dependent dehydrogenase (short-subunit alcohol dehydrogenase family)
MGKYNGKTAVITGGSSGIGFATAKLLIQEGARVLITARSADAIAVAVKELGPNASGLAADVARLTDLDALAAKVQALGKIDFLFVNAGIAKFVPFAQVTPELYDETQAINTRGAFFTAQKLAPHIRAGGAIVFNTSIVDVKGMPTTTFYAASKAALRSLTRTIATELLPAGIRVNAVSPGPITTPIYDKLGLPKDAVAGFQAQMTESNPMKRFGQPEEVARAALYLAFEATYTTGTEIPVDGGLTQL